MTIQILRRSPTRLEIITFQSDQDSLPSYWTIGLKSNRRTLRFLLERRLALVNRDEKINQRSLAV